MQNLQESHRQRQTQAWQDGPILPFRRLHASVEPCWLHTEESEADKVS